LKDKSAKKIKRSTLVVIRIKQHAPEIKEIKYRRHRHRRRMYRRRRH
jgi:hypothetical protein